jgi:two-component system, cell cycle sensor histidine kinase and response regulator CckA
MARSPLFHRLFSTLLLIVGLFSSALYLLSVPLVEEKAYRMELDAGRTILDNVYELAGKIRGGLEEQRAATIDAFQSEMRLTVSLAANYLDYVFERARRGEISREEAEKAAFGGLAAFTAGADNYVWLTDYDSLLLSHPDPDFAGRNAADMQDEQGRFILPTIIERARREGEGYHVYPWRRPGSDDPPIQKMSYFRNLPQYGLVIGAGAYVADIDAAVERRKAQAVADLRQALRNIRIARTGYVYIFDSARRMIIHPNANIEGAAFGDMKNPATGENIGEALIKAAAEGRYLRYLWDKPDDPGNYAYEKISWVRHFEGFDWYIASSVYEKELRSSATELGERLFAVSAAVMVLGGVLSYFGARRLVQPLRRLADAAARVRAGDLSARSGVRRSDEVGVLAATFDAMVQRVRDDIETLDSRVKERTAALQIAETRQRLILDAVPVAIAYIDAGERLRFANRLWCDIAQRREGDVLQMNLRDAMGRRVYAATAPWFERARRGETVTFEYALTTRDGRDIVTKNTLIPHLDGAHHDGAERVTGFYFLSADVTEEKETERQLVEAQRLKAVGQLSGGLAHDFNNLLSIILGNLAVARERREAAALEEFLEPAQRAARRGADITARLLAFARRQPLKPQAVETAALARDAALLLRRSLPASITVTTPDQTAGEAWVTADPAQLENALVNLSLNARDAMPDGGELEISVGLRERNFGAEFDEPPVPRRYVEITVRDNGCGFAPGGKARAFEPFYTTKSFGSGLGLSMVYGFVKQSGGYIRIDSEPGVGAMITLLLPQINPPSVKPAATSPAPQTAAAPAEWSGRLALVAEDDADVRHVMRGQLVELGFSVLEAANGEEALELAEQLDDLALVVSDIVMPGLSGLALARRLRTARPDVQVILFSGFSVEEIDDAEGLVILGKPWEKCDLAAAIRPPSDKMNRP